MTDSHVLSSGQCSALAFSRDGSMLFSARIDGSLQVWDLKAGAMVANTAVGVDVCDIVAAALESDAVLLRKLHGRSSSFSRISGLAEISKWHQHNGESRHSATFRFKEPAIAILAPNGNVIVCFDSMLRWVDVATMREIAAVAIPPGRKLRPSESVLGTDGRRVALGSRNAARSIIVLDRLMNTMVVELNVNDPATITAMRFSKNGKLLAVGTADGRQLLWDIQSQSLLFDQPYQSSIDAVVMDIRFIKAGQLLLFAMHDGRLLIRRCETGSLSTVAYTGGPIMSVDVSPNGRILAIAGRHLRLVDLQMLYQKQSDETSTSRLDWLRKQ